MNCATARDQLGAYVDGELPAQLKEAVRDHLTACAACASELELLERLAASMGPSSVKPPANLWACIEQRLDSQPVVRPNRVVARLNRRTYAIAAGLLLAASVGLFTWNRGGGLVPSAQASTLDFGALLDAVPDNAEKAFEDFLTRYQARLQTPDEVKRSASALNFDIPDTLPGGFRRMATYSLRFGDAPGAAARYARNGEFLGAIFHTPVHQEDFGTHKDYPCAIGKHHGHKVAVGEWKLVHVTDPTTCHCVLSKLDEATQLPPVLAALAPTSAKDISH